MNINPAKPSSGWIKRFAADHDEWIDVFADWDADAQEAALDLAGCIHRQTKRLKGPRKDEEAVEARVEQAALPGVTGTRGEA
jgi:hypothetical protein